MRKTRTFFFYLFFCCGCCLEVSFALLVEHPNKSSERKVALCVLTAHTIFLYQWTIRLYCWLVMHQTSFQVEKLFLTLEQRRLKLTAQRFVASSSASVCTRSHRKNCRRKLACLWVDVNSLELKRGRRTRILFIRSFSVMFRLFRSAALCLWEIFEVSIVRT